LGQTLTLAFWAKIPSILGALVLLLLGSFLGRWLRRGVEKVLNFTKLDEYTNKIGVGNILNKLGVGQSPARIIGFLVYWLVFLAFLLSAANVIQLTVVSEFLQQIVLFMPKVIAAVFVLGGGLFLGHFLAEIVLKSAKANNLKGADMLSKATYGILVVFSALMALERLGINTSVISRSLEIVIAGICLGLAIAMGLAFGSAGKDVAAKWIQDLTKKN